MPIVARCGLGEVEVLKEGSIGLEAHEGVDKVAEIGHDAESIM